MIGEICYLSFIDVGSLFQIDPNTLSNIIYQKINSISTTEFIFIFQGFLVCLSTFILSVIVYRYTYIFKDLVITGVVRNLSYNLEQDGIDKLNEIEATETNALLFPLDEI